MSSPYLLTVSKVNDPVAYANAMHKLFEKNNHLLSKFPILNKLYATLINSKIVDQINIDLPHIIEAEIHPNSVEKVLKSISEYTYNLNLQFEKCPRCFSVWKEDWKEFTTIEYGEESIYICMNCNIKFYPAIDMIVWRSPIIKDKHLAWSLKEHICIYATIEERIDGKEIILPFLPYDISLERFRNLLVYQ